MAPQQKETHPRKKRLLRDIDGSKWDKRATNESLVSTTDPYECKRLGHKIEGFNQEKWDEQAPKVCNRALREKVDQSSFVKEFLISTGDKILAEAAPNSKWACGLKLKDKNILDISKWERVGHGGMVYMQIRSEITGRPMPDISKVGVPIPVAPVKSPTAPAIPDGTAPAEKKEGASVTD